MVSNTTKFWNVVAALIMGLITTYSACHLEKYPILLVIFFGALFGLQVSKTIVDFVS